MIARRTRRANFSVEAQGVAHYVPVSPHDDLYFFRADNGLVKIGRSANVRVRLNHVRCSSPVGVMLWAVLEGRGHEEMAWHCHFNEQRRNGEWFKWCPQINRAIRLAQNGRKWWKPNVTVPDTDDDRKVEWLINYWRDQELQAA